MRRNADTGIQITTHVAKDIKTRNKQSLFSVIYQLIFLVLAAYGTIFSGITGIDITVNKKIIMSIIIIVGIFFGLCFMYIKKVYYIVLPVLGGIVGIALFVHKSVTEGFMRIYNIFIVSYNSYYNTELKPFQLENMVSTKNTTLCIGLLSIIFIMLIAYCLLRSHLAIYYLFITVPFIFVPYMVGLLPDATPFYCYIISTFVMLTPVLAFGKGAFRNYNIQFRLNIVMTILTLSAFIIGYVQITPKRYQTMNVGALKQSVQSGVQSYSINSIFHTNPLQVLLAKSHSASGGMSGGTLGESSSLQFNNKTMLEVKLEKECSTPIYIKGYVGQVYDHNEWNTLDSKDKRAFDSLNQEYETKRLNTEGLSKAYTELSSLYGKTNSISIKNVGNSNSASFVPYSSNDLCEIGDNGYLKWKGTDLGYIEYKTNYWMLNCFIPGTVGSSSSQRIMENNLVAKELLSSALKKYMLQSTFGESLDIIKQDMGQYEDNDASIDSHITDMPAIRAWLDKHEELESCVDFDEDENIPGAITLADKFSTYIDFESKVEPLVYKAYTKLPKDSLGQVRKLVRGWYKPSRVLLNTHDEALNYAFHQFDQYDRYSDYVKAIAKVKNYLATHTKYSLNPGELPKGEDFVENFLFEKKKGYCMHYASAATVMFRAMGIPARYVEGYIVTKSDVNSANRKTGKISIKDKNAHAWTEIYLDGYGWMPVEVTPAYERENGKEIPVEISTALKKGTMGKDKSHPKATVTPKAKPTKKPIVNKENSNNSGNSKSNSKFGLNLPKEVLYVIKVIALSVMTIILLFLVIKTRIFIIKKRRKRAMDGDNSRKLLAQYRLFQKTMKEYQIQYESTSSVDTLYDQCMVMFPEIEKDDLRRYINLALKAKYDCKRVSKEETRKADSLYRKFMKQIGSNSKKTKRLFLRYIKVLEV